MADIAGPLAADQEFFRALLAADTQLLDLLLVEDFVIVDVMSGGETGKAELLEALGSARLKFHTIASAENHVRIYGGAAVVIGRTAMRLSFDGTPVEVKSRYTHVYVKLGDGWRMASAQGTQIPV